MFFFCVGDAVSQAAQSFLPSVIGRPSAAQRLGRQLMSTGVFVGIVNCAAAGTVNCFRMPNQHSMTLAVVHSMTLEVVLFINSALDTISAMGHHQGGLRQ